MSGLAERLARAVAGGPLAAEFGAFVEAGGAGAGRLSEPVLRGVARVLGSQPRLGGLLARPALLERLAGAGPQSLREWGRELAAGPGEAGEGDLERALDELRLLRRQETALAACLDLAGLVPFPAVSEFLSLLAEHVAGRAYALARRSLGPRPGVPLAVIGMGKLAGREFSYHSDLDLVFLFQGGIEAIDAASRAAQRMISYLTTMTGAGVAYAVDARLRPSGQQGALVTSFAGFERYQTEEAETWEHVAGLRARPIAGDVTIAAATLARVHAAILARRKPPWVYLADLRARVERERGSESGGSIALKTGPGGLMDADFLAAGALLERGAERFPELPSVAAMLRAGARGPRVDALLEDYEWLRLVEARTRWCAGRAVESLDPDGARRARVAELVEPGLAPERLVARIAATRGRIRAAWNAVIAADTIAALG